MYEFIKDIDGVKKYVNSIIKIISVNFVANGTQTDFSVGENIGTLFSVSINGLAQERDTHYTHISYTTKITFTNPPNSGSIINIQYYQGINSVILDSSGKLINFTIEKFTFTGNTIFNLTQSINSVFGVETNGLAEEEGIGYDISSSKQITYLANPLIGSKVMISYFY